CVFLSSLLIPPPLRSPLFPYTTLFRSEVIVVEGLGPDGHGLALADELAEGMHGKVHIGAGAVGVVHIVQIRRGADPDQPAAVFIDRKSTRLNSSHVSISYAVFCLKKKK